VGLFHGRDVLIFFNERKERSILMKRVLGLFVCVGLLLFSPLAYAQSVKIGTIDLQRILKESKRSQKEHEAFNKKKDALNKEVNKKEEEIRVLKESIEKKLTSGMLNEQARRDLEKEYQQKVRDYEYFKRDTGIEAQRLYQEMYLRVLKGVNTVVNKLGEEGNYTLVVDLAAIAYAPDGLDITDQVIKAFDASKE
jgi:outer membrane protein